MKVITIHRVEVQFDADQVTQGTAEQQVSLAIDLINLTLQREPFGLGAQLIGYTAMGHTGLSLKRMFVRDGLTFGCHG